MMKPKSTNEINAEKAAKPRPDLLPARAVNRIYQDSDDVIDDAWTSLLFFREEVGFENLYHAAGVVAHVLGGLPQACMAGGHVMGYGFRKHGNCTWRVAGSEQADPQTHIASAERHLLEYLIDPEAREEGSGYPVLWHAFSQLCITIDLVLDPPQELGVNDGKGTVSERYGVVKHPIEKLQERAARVKGPAIERVRALRESGDSEVPEPGDTEATERAWREHRAGEYVTTEELIADVFDPGDDTGWRGCP